MARRADPTPGRQRLVGLAAVAGLSAGTALAFGRVFAGRLPTLLLVAAALSSVLVAALLERRGLVLATIASLIGLGLAIAWIVLPQTTWFGVPTLRTLRAIGRCLEFVGQQARVRVAPTAPFAPLLLAAVTAVWTAAFSAHALAIRAGSPLLAALPAIALVGFADTVLDDGARPVYAIGLLAAVLAVVFADGLRRVRQWGPLWSGSRARRFGASVKGSRSVASMVILAAVLVPGLLPGFRSEALVDVSTTGTGGVGLEPFVDILGQLDQQAARDLFEVDSERTSPYWRLYALDAFDGESWTSSDATGSESTRVLAPPAELPMPIGYPDPPATTFPQEFRILTEFTGLLPMAPVPEHISAPLDEIVWDPYQAQARVDGLLDAGLEYTVRSRAVVPTPEQLDRVIPLTSAQYGSLTHVPDTVDPRIAEIALGWTAGEPNAYRKVLAIMRRLRDTEGPGAFTYSTEGIGAEDDADALLTFLTETRTGFCVQFATAMAVLVRELGLPARVAGGYQTGERVDEDTFVVRTSDAHLWVEVYFERYGWLTFEPTPGRGTNPATQTGTYLNPTESQEVGPDGEPIDVTEVGPGGAGGPVCPEEGPVGGPLSGQLCNAERRRGAGGGAGARESFVPPEPAAEQESGYSVPYRLIFLGLLVALGVLLVVVPIAKSVWRHRIVRRAREPREHVLAAHRVFDGEAADLGLGRRDGETLEEHRARLAAQIAFSDGHLGRLTSLAARAAYSPVPPSDDEARMSVQDARRAIKDLRRETGVVRRVLGTYRPGL